MPVMEAKAGEKYPVTGDSQRGGAVELTIKPEIQQAAYDALAGREGAVVALDPKTGAILALVSTPSYDPSAFATRNGNAANEANATLSQDSSRPLDNRASAAAVVRILKVDPGG